MAACSLEDGQLEELTLSEGHFFLDKAQRFELEPLRIHEFCSNKMKLFVGLASVPYSQHEYSFSYESVDNPVVADAKLV